MSLKKKDKGARTDIDKIIILVIVIAVIVMVLLFIFKVDILKYFKNLLPDLGNNNNIEDNLVDQEPLKEITEQDLLKVMNYYKDNNVANSEGNLKRCDCGRECALYAKSIKKYSDKNNLDPSVVLAVIMQESNCQKNQVSQLKCVGLMQICVDSWSICVKDLGLTSETWRETLLKNPDKNIACGTKILKAKYDEYKNGVYESRPYKTNDYFRKDVDLCITEYPFFENYEDIDAALRGYNGWACKDDSQIYYVENVNLIEERLRVTSV
ncbi:MAG: transglycosylase SLT domain-containing protein [Nanoarchaeota archaeon]